MPFSPVGSLPAQAPVFNLPGLGIRVHPAPPPIPLAPSIDWLPFGPSRRVSSSLFLRSRSRPAWYAIADQTLTAPARRRTLSLPTRRARSAFSTPTFAPLIVATTRHRAHFGRPTRSKPQGVFADAPVALAPARSRPRLPRRSWRAQNWFWPQAVVVLASSWLPNPARRLLRLLASTRPRQSGVPVPAQVIVAPAFVPTQTRRARLLLASRRTRGSLVAPSALLVPQALRRALQLPRRRSRATSFPWPQAVLIAPSWVQQRARRLLRAWFPRRLRGWIRVPDPGIAPAPGKVVASVDSASKVNPTVTS